MTIYSTDTTRRESLLMRIIYSVPLVGTIARDIARGHENIYYALVILLTLVVVGIKTWGVVALAMMALAMVPVMFVTLVLLTRG